MPVYVVDQDLSEDSGRDGGVRPALSSAASVGITLTASGVDSSSAKDIHVVVAKGADGAVDASGSAMGGSAGMAALLRLLTKRLARAAEHGAKAASEATTTRRDHLPEFPGPGPEGQVHEGSPVSDGSFNSELRVLLEGGSLDDGQLAPALARFSAAFIFHLQRELHSATLKLDA